MELLDMQQSAEELLEQLNQLKDFSDKYKQNSIQAGDAILRSTDVLSASEQMLARVNFLVEQVGETIKAETEKLEALKTQVSETVAEQGGALRKNSNETLQILQASFLAEQQKHVQEIQEKCNKAEALLESYNNAIHANLEKVVADIKDLQLDVKKEFQVQQAEIDKETGNRLVKIEEVLSERSGAITKAAQDMRLQTTETLQNITSDITSRINSLERQNEQFIEDNRINIFSRMSESDRKLREQLVELSEKHAKDNDAATAALMQAKNENKQLHITQIVLLVVLVLLMLKSLF
jgi:hypothetical protein